MVPRRRAWMKRCEGFMLPVWVVQLEGFCKEVDGVVEGMESVL